MANKIIEELYRIEDGLRRQGLEAVCGVDEAGRGPLAGPVVAGAVILPAGLRIDWLNDSKKLTEKRREAIYQTVTEQAVWAVGLASEREIDELNILNASMLAMRRAVAALSVSAQHALVDGNRDPELGIPTTTLVKGDSKTACIAAASVIAKVTRDRMLLELDKKYPQYGFVAHKGYPTKAHYEAIAAYGILPEHRRSFLRTLGEHVAQ